MAHHEHILDPNAGASQEAQWISLSDLMTGLMMIFMLLAIAFMERVETTANKEKQAAISDADVKKALTDKLNEETKKYDELKKSDAELLKIQQVAVIYDQTRQAIYDALHKEFDKDLQGWGAEITKDLAVRFNNPDVLFDTGQDELKPKFQAILQNFFPRYVKIIQAPEYKDAIEEVRIEGHTSSAWGAIKDPEEAYFHNMELSQSRTRSTLRFVLALPEVKSEATWLQKHMTANGLSSSHIIQKSSGEEDAARSQRVEFRIRTNAEVQIESIVQKSGLTNPH